MAGGSFGARIPVLEASKASAVLSAVGGRTIAVHRLDLISILGAGCNTEFSTGADHKLGRGRVQVLGVQRNSSTTVLA